MPKNLSEQELTKQLVDLLMQLPAEKVDIDENGYYDWMING